jgi:hypothetical protein
LLLFPLLLLLLHIRHSLFERRELGDRHLVGQNLQTAQSSCAKSGKIGRFRQPGSNCAGRTAPHE